MLMARIAEQDPEAFKALMGRHMRSSIRLAERILLSPSEADDVAQEAFLRVWRKAADFDPSRSQFRTWLYRIVVNLAIDRKRAPRTEPIEVAMYISGDDIPPIETLIAREEAELVEAGMAMLKDKYRAAIALFHREGLALRDAAQTMGLSERAFGSLLTRARLALKAEVEDRMKQRKRGAQ